MHFTGYGSETKGYMPYYPEQRRVFYSRDVFIIFHEFSNYSVDEEPSATKEDEEKRERLVERGASSTEMKNQSSNCKGQLESESRQITTVNG